MQAVVDELVNDPVMPRPAARPLQEVAPDLAALYDEHSRFIYHLSLRLLGDPQKAEDATHDVFLKAWKHIDQFEGRSTWRTWLYRVAINHCHSLQTKWSERHIHSTDSPHVLEDTVVDQTSPLRVIELKELGERIQHTLDRPDSHDRQAFQTSSPTTGGTDR
jgi:RNA polymerase sigma-70 factor (ECF subfamily)